MIVIFQCYRFVFEALALVDQSDEKWAFHVCWFLLCPKILNTKIYLCYCIWSTVKRSLICNKKRQQREDFFFKTVEEVLRVDE